MSDDVSAFLRATERADVPAIMATLAPGAQLASPLVHGATFTGEKDLEILLSAVYGTLRNLTWEEAFEDGGVHTVLGTCTVWGRPIHDAMILRTNEGGRITHIQPHLRPWSGLTVFALAVGPKLARNPQLMRRAMGAR